MYSGRKFIYFLLLMIPYFGFCQNPFMANQRPYRITLPEPNWKEVKSVDSLHPGNRVSIPILVDLNLENSGKWTVDENGFRKWNLVIEAPSSALALAALLDTFKLSDGAVLSVFSGENVLPSARYISSGLIIEKKLLGFLVQIKFDWNYLNLLMLKQ